MIGDFNVEEYCFSHLDKARITSTGQIEAVCPWCGKFGGFYINSKTGHYICFKCDNRGRHLIGIIAVVEGVSWRDAKTSLLKKAVKFRRRETPNSLLEKIMAIRPTDVEEQSAGIVDCPLPDEFIPVFDKGRWSYPTYLKERRVKRETALEWGMGYCNNGRYKNRVIIPISCDNGNSFTARDVTGNSRPKYLNPKGVNHSRLLFGWDKLDKNRDVVLVEGPLDAIMLWQHGLNSVALLGKVLHKAQLGMMINGLGSDVTIIVMLDPEEDVAPLDVARQLLCKWRNIYLAKLPLGVDPGSSSREQALSACDQSVEFDNRGVLSLRLLLDFSSKWLGNC